MSEKEKQRMKNVMSKLNKASYHDAEIALAYINGRNDERARMEYEAAQKEKKQCNEAKLANA